MRRKIDPRQFHWSHILSRQIDFEAAMLLHSNVITRIQIVSKVLSRDLLNTKLKFLVPLSIALKKRMCGTVSSMLSGLKTRSLGLNTLGTTLYPASSQSVQVGRPSTASRVQPVLSKVNVTCSRPQRNVHRPGFEPGTPWSEIRRPNHCATPPPSKRRMHIQVKQ